MSLTAQNDCYLSKWFINDEKFDKLYPLNVQKLSGKHWTSLEVAKIAAEFLAPERNMHVLDIGSGVGKFCIAAAHHKPTSVFYGVEQRKKLVDYAINCSRRLNIHNVSFIHGNFTQLDLRQFNSFYFYNSFYENLEGTAKIDNKIKHSLSLFNYYTSDLFNQLAKMPTGTRIATFHAWETSMPPGFSLVKTQFGMMLSFWIKKS